MQRNVALHLKRPLAEAGNLADRFAGEFWRVEGADIGAAFIDEVVGGTAVKGFFRLRREEKGATAGGCAPPAFSSVDDSVELLPVTGGDVFDVGQILKPAFDLERADASLDQRPQVGALVVVLEREQVFAGEQRCSGCVGERVGKAAGLRTVATISAAPGVNLTDRKSVV